MYERNDVSGSTVALRVICLFVFSIPFENMVVWSALGTLTKILGFMALAFSIITILLRGRVHKFGLVEFLLVCFVLDSVSSLMWSISPSLTSNRSWRYIELILMVWYIIEFARDEKSQYAIMKSYILGCFVLFGGTLYSYLIGHNSFGLRYVASGFDPNDLGLTLSIAIPMAWYVAPHLNHWSKRLVFKMYIPLAAFGVLLTASRGAFLALLISLTTLLWPEQKVRLRGLVLKTIYILVGMGVFIRVVPASSWTRILTIQQQLHGGTFDGRTPLWHAGFYVFVHNPLFGVGAGAFMPSVGGILGYEQVAHNLFLDVAVEQGVIGLGLLICALCWWAIQSLRMPIQERKLWIIILLTWAVGVFSLSWEYQKPTWLLFALVASQGQMFKRGRTQRTAIEVSS